MRSAILPLFVRRSNKKKLEEREHTRQQKGSRLGGSGASVINKGLPDRLFDEGLPQR